MTPMARRRLPGADDMPARGVLVVLALLVPAGAAAQDRPLPDRDAFLREVRARLENPEERQSSYAYVETEREQKLDESGRATSETVKVFEVYPGLPGQRRWRRLISENGVPLSAAALEKQDRKRQDEAEEYLRKRATQTDADRAKQAREREKRRREDAEAIDEIYRVYDISMLRRERLDGHDTIVFSLTPRAVAKPRTREGKIMQKTAATAWVSESDFEVARVEVKAIDTISIGWGLLARVHEGSRAAIQRVKVNGEEWLPASVSYTASARVALLKMYREGGSSEFSNYRKFTVDTSTTYAVPKTPGTPRR
jgi:hypothetical protein